MNLQARVALKNLKAFGDNNNHNLPDTLLLGGCSWSVFTQHRAAAAASQRTKMNFKQ